MFGHPSILSSLYHSGTLYSYCHPLLHEPIYTYMLMVLSNGINNLLYVFLIFIITRCDRIRVFIRRWKVFLESDTSLYANISTNIQIYTACTDMCYYTMYPAVLLSPSVSSSTAFTIASACSSSSGGSRSIALTSIISHSSSK